MQYKGGLFYIPAAMGERLMDPPKYVEELKNVVAERADLPATFVEVRSLIFNIIVWFHLTKWL